MENIQKQFTFYDKGKYYYTNPEDCSQYKVYNKLVKEHPYHSQIEKFNSKIQTIKGRKQELYRVRKELQQAKGAAAELERVRRKLQQTENELQGIKGKTKKQNDPNKERQQELAAQAAREFEQKKGARKQPQSQPKLQPKSQPQKTVKTTTCRNETKECGSDGQWGKSNLNFDFGRKKSMPTTQKKKEKDRKEGGKMFQCYLKLKKNPLGQEYVEVDGNTLINKRATVTLGKKIGKDNKHNFDKFKMTEASDVTFDKIITDSGTAGNKDLYDSSLREKIQNFNKDIFLSAYGTSGSGKTYTLLGEKGVNGVLKFALDDILKKEGIESLKILPLQIYKGSVYNAFYPGGKGIKPIMLKNEYSVKKHGSNVETFETLKDIAQQKFDWFDEHRECIIPEFNYLDMYDCRVPERIYVKDENDALYPPSRDIIECLFEVSDTSIPGYQAQEISNMDSDGIIKLIENEIIINRPVRSTELNPESSRSHLFIIFRIKINDEIRYFTLLDMAGYERWNTGKKDQGEFLPEGRNIVEGGIVPFRKIISQYQQNKFYGKISSQIPKRDNIYNVEGSDCLLNYGKGSLIGGKSTRLVKIDDTNLAKTANETFPILDDSILQVSSSMFNLLRGVSDIYSDNDSDNLIYIMGYEKWNTKNSDASLTGTVLFNFAPSWTNIYDKK